MIYLLWCRACGDPDRPLPIPFGSAAERGRWAAEHTRRTGHEAWVVLAQDDDGRVHIGVLPGSAPACIRRTRLIQSETERSFFVFVSTAIPGTGHGYRPRGLRQGWLRSQLPRRRSQLLYRRIPQTAHWPRSCYQRLRVRSPPRPPRGRVAQWQSAGLRCESRTAVQTGRRGNRVVG